MDDRVKNAKELVMIAKQLLAKKIDGIDILQKYKKIFKKIVEIEREKEELRRKQYQLSRSSEGVKDLYELAKDMRAELDKVFSILKRKGVKISLTNDFPSQPDEYINYGAFLNKQNGREFGLISFSLFLKEHIDIDYNDNKVFLKIAFFCRNDDTGFQLNIEGDKLLRNTLSQWKKFLNKAIKEIEKSL